ncbi:MAG: preprotein translocase subunit YajC [Firmicutes bacterium ZCTH02-B6]|nr:MAG: preprotein translocase subunit YajC [Firmicutes bacterium ZCTH02-B6]
MLGSLLPLILMFAVFYFLLIRPQMQQQKKRKEMLDRLKVGDKVITVGGIHGEITAVKDDEVQLRIADKVEIRLSRQGVGHVKGRD